MSAALAAAPLPHRAAIYCRISRDATGQKVGVERQEELCRDLAAGLDWEVAEVIVDNDVSAFSGVKRPGYERLLSLVENGEVEAIVAYHPDRLYRRLADLERLTTVISKAGCPVRTVAAGDVDLSTASGVFTAQVLGAAAQHESARTGERVKAAHAANAKKGRMGGGPRPFGFQRLGPGELAVDEEEAKILREMAARAMRGESMRSLVNDLNARGITTSTGGFWRDRGLRMALSSPRMAGLVPLGKSGEYVTGVEANWPAIFERTEWERVRNVLAATPRGRRPRSFLLSGFIWCGSCGHRLHSHLTSVQGDRPSRRRYRCLREVHPEACASVSAEAQPLEGFVIERVLAVVEGANLADVRAERTVSERTRLVHEIADDEALLSDLMAQLAARQITRAEWTSARPIIDQRLRENRAALARLGRDDRLPPNIVSLDRAGFDALDFNARRALLQLFVERVVVDRVKARSNRFDTGRVRIGWKQ